MRKRKYKIEDEDWELKYSKESDTFLQLDYRRSHENYERDQRKIKIYKKYRYKLILVVEFTTGVLGGSWTATLLTYLSDDLELRDGRGTSRIGVNTGTKGYINYVDLDTEKDKIIINHTYKTGSWSRVRSWTIEQVDR